MLDFESKETYLINQQTMKENFNWTYGLPNNVPYD